MVHADVATDEGAMAFRQSAAHRLVATGTATFVPAQRPAVTKIPAKEVASAAAAKSPVAAQAAARCTRAAPRVRRLCPGSRRAAAPATASGQQEQRAAVDGAADTAPGPAAAPGPPTPPAPGPAAAPAPQTQLADALKDQQYDAFMKWVGEVGGLQNAQAPNCERDPTYLYVPPSSIHKI